MPLLDCSGYLQHKSGKSCCRFGLTGQGRLLHQQYLQSNRHRRCRSRPLKQACSQRQLSRLPVLGMHFPLPSICHTSHAQRPLTGSISGMAADSLGAIRRSSGEKMVQLYTGSRHLNPFTQIVWRRGRRRWMGLRAGRWTAMEQPAAWVLDLRHWVLGLQQQLQLGWLQVQHHVHQAALQLHYIPLPSVLLAAAVTLALLLLAAAVKQRQAQKQSARSPADSEMLARKAASLDQQRSRFRRALGGDEEPTTESSSTSGAVTVIPQDIVTDQHAEKGQDNFDPWDADTEQQWKQFLKGSRSQEIEQEQWWDIDREELPADRQVHQDFN